jgi:energy-coupling factor transporter ATP-binding protein EcfA2
MKFRLIGKDFQSWKKFDLSVSGFTVIVGSSNRGKTALIRALRGILRNQVQEAHIRKGEKSTEVGLEIDQGPVVSLTRGKTTTYKIDSKDFSKLAGDVPEDIKALNVHQITVGGTKLDPVFAGQFDSQFMMDLSPQDLNNVMGLFSNTERLNQGKRAIGVSNTEINSQAKLLAQEIQDGHIKVAKLRVFATEFKKLKPQYDELNDSVLSLHTAKNLIVRRQQVGTTLKAIRIRAEMPLPAVLDLERWFALGKLLRTAQRAREAVQRGRKALEPIGTQKWVTLTNHYRLIRSAKTIRRNLRDIPELVDKSNLDKLLRVRKSVEWMISARMDLLDYRDTFRKNEEELKKAKAELHGLTEKAQTCPKCGYQF